MENSSGLQAAFRVMTERPLPIPPPPRDAVESGGSPRKGREVPPLVCWTHPEWAQRFPWLVQGTTSRSPGPAGGDFRLFGTEGQQVAQERWMELARSQGFSGVAHARQVHGKKILIHEAPAEGLSVGEDADGHFSSAPGTLMAVTVADCVPVFLVDPGRRAVALLHAGWRGTAAGILEEGISLLADQCPSGPEGILVHLGPAICQDCYEVGPEVHTALGLREPEGPAPVDLRGVLGERALRMGVMRANVTRSSFCTLCGGSPFYSHRGGATQRQVGFVGIGLP
jgi:YfiH family protein